MTSSSWPPPRMSSSSGGGRTLPRTVQEDTSAARARRSGRDWHIRRLRRGIGGGRVVVRRPRTGRRTGRRAGVGPVPGTERGRGRRRQPRPAGTLERDRERRLAHAAAGSRLELADRRQRPRVSHYRRQRRRDRGAGGRLVSVRGARGAAGRPPLAGLRARPRDRGGTLAQGVAHRRAGVVAPSEEHFRVGDPGTSPTCSAVRRIWSSTRRRSRCRLWRRIAGGSRKCRPG